VAAVCSVEGIYVPESQVVEPGQMLSFAGAEGSHAGEYVGYSRISLASTTVMVRCPLQI